VTSNKIFSYVQWISGLAGKRGATIKRQFYLEADKKKGRHKNAARYKIQYPMKNQT